MLYLRGIKKNLLLDNVKVCCACGGGGLNSKGNHIYGYGIWIPNSLLYIWIPITMDNAPPEVCCHANKSVCFAQTWCYIFICLW